MSSVFQLTGTTDRPRLRPGERPRWLDVSNDRGSFDDWRREAANAAIAVDVWVALLLELQLVMDDLRPLGDPAELLRNAVESDSSVLHLCASEPLRSWPHQLSDPRSAHDDLPELLLPERVALRLPGGAQLGPRLNPELFDLARSCERRAASQCRTLESWALSAVISGLWDASSG